MRKALILEYSHMFTRLQKSCTYFLYCKSVLAKGVMKTKVCRFHQVIKYKRSTKINLDSIRVIHVYFEVLKEKMACRPILVTYYRDVTSDLVLLPLGLNLIKRSVMSIKNHLLLFRFTGSITTNTKFATTRKLPL